MDVRSAAGDHVQVFHANHAQSAFAGRRHAQIGLLVRIAVFDGDRAVLGNHLVGAQFDSLDVFGTERSGGDVDSGCVFTEMKTDGGHAAALDGDGGKQMLAAVLLHVIEAPHPIHAALNIFGEHWLGQGVNNALPLVLFNAHDRHAVDGSQIVRLAPRSRVERRAVQDQTTAVVAAIQHARAELSEIGIAVIEPLGH